MIERGVTRERAGTARLGVVGMRAYANDFEFARHRWRGFVLRRRARQGAGGHQHGRRDRERVLHEAAARH